MNVTFPLRAAFTYPWFPETNFGHYKPQLDFYDSSDPAVVTQHTAWLAYARVRVGIASWWGPQGTGTNHHEDVRIPALLDAAAELKWPLAWTVYFEHGDADSTTITDWLAYLNRYTSHPRWAHIDGKPVIFIYNVTGGETISDRWAQAAPGWFYVPKLFEGWRDVSPQPPSWHQYGPSTPYQEHADGNGVMISSALSAGFWKGSDSTPNLARDPARYAADADRQVASRAHWQIITTFNEWGEGTAIEPEATHWGMDYLDILHARPYRSKS